MAAPIAITMGDPAGVGPEIIVKALSTLSGPTLVLGDPVVMQAALNAYAPQRRLVVRDDIDAMRFERDTLELLATSQLAKLPAVGQVNADAGLAAFQAIVAGIDLARAGKISAIVTAPINKAAFAAAGIDYPGHTELLADRGGAHDVAMMLANDVLRVVLVTIHCSMRDAIQRADFDAQMRAIQHAHDGARAFGVTNPRIAVAGLNPHAGENGLFGYEEADIIGPAIAASCKLGMDVTGPWPGDTVFAQARQGRFDVVVAQYHDQGLIPIKYMGLEQGVNITLGLPFVRTSPDHGTAFDIAWQGKADPASLLSALRCAGDLAALVTN